MSKSIFYFLFLYSFILITGCIKDSEEFVPNGSGKVYTARIFGIVNDEFGNPIEGATITYKGQSFNSDQYGIFKIENALVDSKHNFLKISKLGFFNGIRSFRTDHSKTIQLKTQLIQKNFKYEFLNSLGGSVSENNVTISFNPNSVVVESTGIEYTGKVKVAMKYLDPTKYNTNEQMQGDLSGLDLMNQLVTLNSFGMVYVELESPEGIKLQLKKGETATIKSIIPSEIVDEANSEVPMWYFDESLGLWKEEGKAVKINGEYVAIVGHFSCWNYDYDQPAIILSGRLVDQSGNPINGMHVWISKAGEYLGGHGNVDDDGTFSGRAPKDVLLDFKVFSLGSTCSYNEPIFIKQLGPFSVDTNIGDIVITILQDQICNVKGTFVDCDGNPLSDGFVKVDNFYYELTDGNLNVGIHVCNANQKQLTATDRVKAKTIVPIQLTSPGINDLGTVSICQLDADFFKIKSDALGLDIVLLDSISMNSIGSHKLLEGSGMDNGKNCWFYISMSDPNNLGICVPGTYPTANSEGIYISDTSDPNNGKFYQILNGSIVITQGGNIGDRIKGTYTLLAKEESSGNTYDFYGNFQLLLE